MPDDATLDQRWWIETRSFRIQEDGVHVSYAQLMNTQHFRIPFESIPSDTIQTTKRHPIWLVLTTVFVVFAVLGTTLSLGQEEGGKTFQVGVVLSAIAAACAALFLTTRQRLIAFATGDNSLVFFATSPSEARVDEFMSAVVDARDAYLRTHYQGSQAGESPIDAIERLHALKERDVITQEEFETLKARVIGPVPGAENNHSDGTYL